MITRGCIKHICLKSQVVAKEEINLKTNEAAVNGRGFYITL